VKQLITDNVDLSNEIVFKQWVKELQNALTVEDWHEVGATNEPAFQNSWVNIDATRKARFMKDSFGFVYLAGAVDTGVIGSAIFTLPSGYLPEGVDSGNPNRIFTVSSDGAFGQLSINYLGEVNCSIGSNVSVWFDGVIFKAA